MSIYFFFFCLECDMELAKTTWASGVVDDQLAAVDVYGVKSTQVKNAIVDSLSSFTTNVLGQLTAQNGVIGKLRDAAEVLQGKVGDVDDAQARIQAVLSEGALDIKRLSKDAQNAALKAIGTSLPVEGEMKYLVDGVVHIVRGQNANGSRDFLSQVAQLLGDSDITQFFDLGAEAALWGGLLNEALSLGMGEVVDLLDKDGVVSDQSVVQSAASLSLMQAVKQGDLSVIRKLIDKTGKEKALRQIPDLPQQILMYYRFVPKTDIDYGQRYRLLIAALIQIDPNWDHSQEQGLDRWLTPFTRLSGDAQQLLLKYPGSDYLTEAMVAQAYPALLSTRQQLKSDFPFIAL